MHTPDTPFAGLELTALPRVDIIYPYADADAVLVDAAVAGARRRFGRLRAGKPRG